MAQHLRLETEIAAPPSVVFDHSLSIDVHAASMRRWRGRAIAGRTCGRIGAGEQVTWRAWHAGLPWTLTSRITEYDEPTRFVDEQVRGPFAHYRHVHHLLPSDHGTLMIDDITFAAPLGCAGTLAERCFLRRRVQTLIETRNAYLRALVTPQRSAGSRVPVPWDSSRGWWSCERRRDREPRSLPVTDEHNGPGLTTARRSTVEP